MLRGYIYLVLANDANDRATTASWGITFGVNADEVRGKIVANIMEERPEAAITRVDVREFYNPHASLNAGYLEVPDNYYDYTSIINVIV